MPSGASLVELGAHGAAGKGCGCLGRTPIVATMPTMVMVMQLFLTGLFGLFATLFDDFDVIIEDGGNDGYHVCLDDSSADILGTTNTDVDDALEGQVPLPHAHHILAATLLEDADKAFDAAIDGEDVADPSRGGGEVGEVVERVDEREGRRAVESATVVEGGGDADRRLVDVGDAKVDLPHAGQAVPTEGGRWLQDLRLLSVRRKGGGFRVRLGAVTDGGSGARNPPWGEGSEIDEPTQQPGWCN